METVNFNMSHCDTLKKVQEKLAYFFLLRPLKSAKKMQDVVKLFIF